MLAEEVRSGLVETTHEGTVAVVAPDRTLLASCGDIDRPFFLRSAAKPFQALVSQECGAGLEPLELAMACASHRGFPVQVSLVKSILARAELREMALRCPKTWPLSPVAARAALGAGERSPRRIWHNCSGKHAGFLRACVARGWDPVSYASLDHPLQRKVISYVSELGELSVEPVGVDGCGVPALRTTARAMALMYARLATEPSLGDVFQTMRRYPALIGANREGDTEIAIAINVAAKGGAAGCIGVAVDGRFGLAAKSWDGNGMIASLAAGTALDQLGALPDVAVTALDPLLHPAVMGGGDLVGRFEPRLVLE